MREAEKPGLGETFRRPGDLAPPSPGLSLVGHSRLAATSFFGSPLMSHLWEACQSRRVGQWPPLGPHSFCHLLPCPEDYELPGAQPATDAIVALSVSDEWRCEGALLASMLRVKAAQPGVHGPVGIALLLLPEGPARTQGTV